MSGEGVFPALEGDFLRMFFEVKVVYLNIYHASALVGYVEHQMAR